MNQTVEEEMEEERRAVAVYNQLERAYPHEGRRRLCQRTALIVWGTYARGTDVMALTGTAHPGAT